jgi:hypothetical protein
MNLSLQIAKHFRQIHFGGNWTSVNLKDTLTALDWQQATKQVDAFNSIAALVYHTNYYVSEVLKVLKGSQLNAHDKFSFALEPITSEADWTALLNKTWADAEDFANMIEAMPESKFAEDFTDKKYGSYYSNIHGIIEHTHYHLGQIVMIKKIISQNK